MALQIVTPPAEEPVSLAEAKLHARVDASADDTLITAYIAAARDWAETFTRRALVTQTLRLVLDAFPCTPPGELHPIIRLPRPALQSVGSVKYIDGAGVLQTLAGSDYVADLVSEPGRLVPAYGLSWPATREVLGAVQIEFTAGYGDATAVPEGIKTAIKQLVAHWYEHRESVVTGTIVNEVPQALEMLLWPFRVMRFD